MILWALTTNVHRNIIAFIVKHISEKIASATLVQHQNDIEKSLHDHFKVLLQQKPPGSPYIHTLATSLVI
jgi:hypothetical protein